MDFNLSVVRKAQLDGDGGFTPAIVELNGKFFKVVSYFPDEVDRLEDIELSQLSILRGTEYVLKNQGGYFTIENVEKAIIEQKTFFNLFQRDAVGYLLKPLTEKDSVWGQFDFTVKQQPPNP